MLKYVERQLALHPELLSQPPSVFVCTTAGEHEDICCFWQNWILALSEWLVRNILVQCLQMNGWIRRGGQPCRVVGKLSIAVLY